MEDISLVKFEKKHVEFKVNLINNKKNSQYLHYELPLNIKDTLAWFEKNRDKESRFDAVILEGNKPVGIIGFLNIDNSCAEFYITLESQGRGIATIASKQLLHIGKTTLGLKKIYLTTEVDNIRAQNLFKKIGFTLIEKMNGSEFLKSKDKDRYYYEFYIKE